MRRRLAIFAVAIVAAMTLPSAPATAADPPHAVLDESFEQFGVVYSAVPGTNLLYRFGVQGAAAGSEKSATLTATGPGITIQPSLDFGVCTGAGTPAVTCTGTTDSDSAWFTVTLSIPSSTPPGQAGELTATTPGGASQTVPLWVLDSNAGADLDFHTDGRPGKVGEIVPLTFTIVNHGPSPEPWWGILTDNLTGASIQAIHGCSAATISGYAYQCAHTAPMAVGEAVTISFDILITPDPYDFHIAMFRLGRALTDPNQDNDLPGVDLADRSGGSGSGGGGSGGGGAAQPTASASPTVTATADPSGSVITTEIVDFQPSPAVAGAEATSNSSLWLLGLGVPILLGAGGVVLYLLRRRPQAADAD